MRVSRLRSAGHSRCRKGSVIIMVVAVLALLAVIGTVYIVSARSSRERAAADQVAINFRLAQQAVIKNVTDVIAGSPIDAAGNVGGLQSDGPFGRLAGRRIDMPELNVGLRPGLPNDMGTSEYNKKEKDQAWLASNLYRPSNALSADSRYNDLSLLTTDGFDPKTGAYDLPFFQPGTNIPNGGRMNLVQVITPESLGALQIPLPNGGLDVAAKDAFIQLLPFSEASGLRYRFGVAIRPEIKHVTTTGQKSIRFLYLTCAMLNVIRAVTLHETGLEIFLEDPFLPTVPRIRLQLGINPVALLGSFRFLQVVEPAAN